MSDMTPCCHGEASPLYECILLDFRGLGRVNLSSEGRNTQM